MSYLGIPRPVPACTDEPFPTPNSANVFCKDDIPFESLGDRILKAAKYGADIGTPIVPIFDEENTDDVDVRTAYDVDVFDMSEQFGAQPVAPAGIASSGTSEPQSTEIE